MPAVRPLRVVAARLVRHAAPGTGVEPWLAAGGEIAQPPVVADETAAAAGRQQGRVVEEVETEAAQQDRFARGYGGQVDVGRVGGRDVAQAVPGGVGREAPLDRIGGHRQMALGQDHRGQAGQRAAVVEGEGLVAAGHVPQPGGTRPVRLHAHGRRCLPYDLGEHPLQVTAVVGPGRVLVRAQRAARPLVQARARADRARAVHAVVGEQGHLAGDGVHQQLGRLGGTPDPARPGRIRVDDVHRQPGTGREEFRGGGAQAFQDAGAAGPGPDQGEGERPRLTGRCGFLCRCGCRCRCGFLGRRRQGWNSRAWGAHGSEVRRWGSGRSASSCRRRERESGPAGKD